MNYSIEIAAEEGTNPLPRIVEYLNERHEDMRKSNPRGYMDAFEQRIEILMEEAASIVQMKVDVVPQMNGSLVFRFYPNIYTKWPVQV